jgi:diaminohydroxyphosphoribosylaminopyrimidine deaminase/5-amino-6-(5-phosphoribosylamino)uracil reductase
VIKDTDEAYMDLALDLAEKGRETTSPNPMVGAVVVKDGRIVGKGYHEAVGGPHAEVNAINAAGVHARDAVLYVTLEPCNHTGRTPPCTEKIIAAGIRRVVIAMDDPNPGVTGGGRKYLKAHGIDLSLGVGEARANRLNEAFVTFARTGRPFVTVKCAATLDGRIATRNGDSKWVTGASARSYVHQLRRAVDAILVGIDTVRADDPRLTARTEEGPARDPVRIVIDPSLKIDEDARMLHLVSDAETIIVTGEKIDPAKAARLKKNRIRIWPMPLVKGKIDFNRLLDDLGKREVTHLLIEGGGGIIGSAFRAGIVDKALFFFAPKIMGGDDGVPICRGDGAPKMKDCIELTSIQTRLFDEDVLIEGYVK